MEMVNIQNELKAPKGQENKFGGYKYRSCEDIVEAVKPVLAKYDAYLNITDELEVAGDRVYIKATATVTFKNGPSISASAYAREPLNRKGMDESQITGAASSYARKYALNGLFAIDDTKDADSQDNRESGQMPSTDPVNMEHVERAYQAFKEVVDADTEVMDYKRVQAGFSRLNNNERVALWEKFGSEKPEGSRKGYKAIIKDLLDATDDKAA